MLTCPQCKFKNPNINKFCQNCGTSLTHKICPQCSTKVALNIQHCPQCRTECS
ncbi:MAG: double zinc ribbon domain-containing protein, partial [Aphanizomenon sp.]